MKLIFQKIKLYVKKKKIAEQNENKAKFIMIKSLKFWSVILVFYNTKNI